MSKAAPKRGRPVDPAKRAAILETARELFFEHGYGVGLETIAARAGVSRQTIYNLFESKDDLFAAIVQESSGQITAALAELTPESTPRDVLTALGIRFAYYYAVTEGPTGRIQSLVVAATLLGLAGILGVVAFVGDLLAINRRLLEDVQLGQRRLWYGRGSAVSGADRVDDGAGAAQLDN